MTGNALVARSVCSCSSPRDSRPRRRRLAPKASPVPLCSRLRTPWRPGPLRLIVVERLRNHAHGKDMIVSRNICRLYACTVSLGPLWSRRPHAQVHIHRAGWILLAVVLTRAPSMYHEIDSEAISFHRCDSQQLCPKRKLRKSGVHRPMARCRIYLFALRLDEYPATQNQFHREACASRLQSIQ